MNDLPPNRTNAIDVVNSLLLRENDLIGVNRATYMLLFKDIYREMNFAGIKDTKRYLVYLDKNTNSLPVPDDYFDFCSIYIPGEDGKLYPMMQNKNLSEELIDLSLKKKCSCNCGCNSELCANLKNYEVVETVVSFMMPDGSYEDFTKVSRKLINPDGSYVLEVKEPVAKYTDGIHTSTVLETRTEVICKLDVNECGCVEHTPSNIKAVEDCCAFNNYQLDCGRPVLTSEFINDLSYNFSDDKKRIIFSSKLNHDYVVIRYYATAKTKFLTIPIVAKTVAMLKLQYERVRYDLTFPPRQKESLKQDLSDAESDLRTDLSRLTLSQIYKTLNPPRKMV